MKMGFLGRATAPAGRSPKAPEDDLYEMKNLYPRHTGLPVTVWVSVKGGAGHAARVKVCRRPGARWMRVTRRPSESSQRRTLWQAL